jgi:hypothetical protein
MGVTPGVGMFFFVVLLANNCAQKGYRLTFRLQMCRVTSI